MDGEHDVADAVVQGPTHAAGPRRLDRLPRLAEGTATVRRAIVLALAIGAGVSAQVTSDRLRRAADEPQNWLTYSGTYSGQRYSPLRQIDPTNVKNLEMQWLFQAQVAGSWESSPLVDAGIMYLTQRPNDVVALDAKTGRIFWI